MYVTKMSLFICVMSTYVLTDQEFSISSKDILTVNIYCKIEYFYN